MKETFLIIVLIFTQACLFFMYAGSSMNEEIPMTSYVATFNVHPNIDLKVKPEPSP